MRKLKWAELPKFNQLKWKPLYSDPTSSETSAFVKSHENLAFFWILRAGHMVRGAALAPHSRAPQGSLGHCRRGLTSALGLGVCRGPNRILPAALLSFEPGNSHLRE